MTKNKITFEEFSARVEKAYNGRISVVKETYVNTRHKVTAYCKIHKVYFEVEEARSLTRHFAECPKCLKEKIKEIRENSRTPWDEVLKRFRDKYGNKFRYDESTYNGMKSEMKVHCNDCGSEFEITPIHHLKYINGGCSICHKHKTRTCSKCGREFEVSNHFPDSIDFICKECKHRTKHTKEKTIKEKLVRHRTKRTKEEQIENEKIRKRLYKQNKDYICPCCGQIHKYKEKCQTHELCRRHPNHYWYKNLIPFGFDYSKIGTPEYVDEYYKALEVIKTEYFVNKLSSQLIFEKYNCKEYFKYESVIRNILKTEHITIRIGSFKYISSEHITWDNKIVRLRSSYESDFANMLDEQQIVYEVEKLRVHYYDTQKLKERIALPDFYLPETNTIVEVKSSWTLDKQNMIDKRVAYLELGYNFKLWYEHEYVDLDNLPNNDHNLEVYKRNNGYD